MVTGEFDVRQEAPGALESVRELLNSWLIPNDTRAPTDRFDAYAAARDLPTAEQASLRELRADLRAIVERDISSESRLNEWIDRLEIRVAVCDGRLEFHHNGRTAAGLVVAVLDAIGARQWTRLKACPDCHWVFYDHTKNGSKRWCLMNADGAGGRGCGTIAKVRRHRLKAR